METPFNPNYSEAQIDAAVDNAYKAILNEFKSLLPQLPIEQLRTYVEKSVNGQVCYFFSPLLNMSVDDMLGPKQLSFAKHHNLIAQFGPHIDAAISQCIYQHTAGLINEIGIEDRLEEYNYATKYYEEALIASETKRDYKKTVVAPNQAEQAQLN